MAQPIVYPAAGGSGGASGRVTRSSIVQSRILHDFPPSVPLLARSDWYDTGEEQKRPSVHSPDYIGRMMIEQLQQQESAERKAARDHILARDRSSNRQQPKTKAAHKTKKKRGKHIDTEESKEEGAAAGGDDVDPLLLEEMVQDRLKETIVERLREAFKCPVCQDMLKSPIIFACGHSTCYDCFYSEAGQPRQTFCPVCREIICMSAVTKGWVLSSGMQVLAGDTVLPGYFDKKFAEPQVSSETVMQFRKSIEQRETAAELEKVLRSLLNPQANRLTPSDECAAIVIDNPHASLTVIRDELAKRFKGAYLNPSSRTIAVVL